ncbi:MAG TPA: caspase family protein, partial [Acidobacteriaceae bacterium]|nr:caspase family protein [Acidobacteriaceae bacterium]
SYAEGDASDFASQFSKAQESLQQFREIRRIDLLGANATRANLGAALRLLSGSGQKLSGSQKQLLSGVTAIQPEDGLFLFYAGHGAALKSHFYLIPEDYDPSFPLSDSRSRSISDTDLSDMLEGVSAARSFLIIDACNSGQAIDSKTIVGPTNSTGLAELAYEKGLTILAASKDTEPALEAQQLGGGHGFLTYALVEEGMKRGEAAEDGVLELRPWFTYAVRRVPDLQAAQLDRRALGIAGKDAAKETRQHPRIFYRREPEKDPFIVAKIPAAATSGARAESQP